MNFLQKINKKQQQNGEGRELKNGCCRINIDQSTLVLKRWAHFRKYWTTAWICWYLDGINLGTESQRNMRTIWYYHFPLELLSCPETQRKRSRDRSWRLKGPALQSKKVIKRRDRSYSSSAEKYVHYLRYINPTKFDYLESS